LRPVYFFTGNILPKLKSYPKKMLFELQLIENIQRMTMNPIEEPKAFKKYTTEFDCGGEFELA
jgi:hypothetical protein